MKVTFRPFRGKTTIPDLQTFERDLLTLVEDHVRHIVYAVRIYPPRARGRSRRLYRGWRYGVQHIRDGYLGWITNTERYATYVQGPLQTPENARMGWKRLDKSMLPGVFYRRINEFQKNRFRLR